MKRAFFIYELKKLLSIDYKLIVYNTKHLIGCIDFIYIFE